MRIFNIVEALRPVPPIREIIFIERISSRAFECDSFRRNRRLGHFGASGVSKSSPGRAIYPKGFVTEDLLQNIEIAMTSFSESPGSISPRRVRYSGVGA